MSRVMVAMSGGVDSSVAAALLVEAGHDVVGVTLKLWGGPGDSGCCSVSDTDDARRVADHLGIEHHVFNFESDFTAAVVAPYVEAHGRGLTPNPCIECNRSVKFSRMTRRAEALGFDELATGHHVRLVATPRGRRLARGLDPAKDQSYVLYVIDPGTLGRLRFPVGEMTKDEVRAHAARLGLRTATKAESQDVCFIHSADGRRGFLGERSALTPGLIVDTAGQPVGRTDAVELLTVGQRRGLDLGGGDDRRYVIETDPAAGRVVVGGEAHLRSDRLELADCGWFDPPEGRSVLIQVSAHGRAVSGQVVTRGGGEASVELAEPIRRVAPGQSVVVYDGEVVVGGGRAVRSSPADLS